MNPRWLAAGLLSACFSFSVAQAETVCTVVADVGTGSVLLEQGNCRDRITPASTFKIALSLMGYDAGVLKDPHSPTLPFKKGYVEWGGDKWRRPTDPTDWLKYSVVWYSQQIVESLGKGRVQQYAARFGYGNADMTGYAGNTKEPDFAWISSSLKISPIEQTEFLRKLVSRQLPLNAYAFDMTTRILEKTTLPGDWELQGKTGSAYPRLADGELDEEHPWGWFVGWATNKGRTVVFAHLIKEEKKQPGLAGVRARGAFLAEFPALVDSRLRQVTELAPQ